MNSDVIRSALACFSVALVPLAADQDSSHREFQVVSLGQIQLPKHATDIGPIVPCPSGEESTGAGFAVGVAIPGSKWPLQRILLYSGTGLRNRLTVEIREPGAVSGYLAVEQIGDIDRDGWKDLCAATPNASGGGKLRGVVSIYSGRNGSVIRRMTGDRNYGCLGSTGRYSFSLDGSGILRVGDVDGDDIHDVALVSPGQLPGVSLPTAAPAPLVQVNSTASGSMIWRKELGSDTGSCLASVFVAPGAAESADYGIGVSLIAGTRSEILVLATADGKELRRIRTPGCGAVLCALKQADAPGGLFVWNCRSNGVSVLSGQDGEVQYELDASATHGAAIGDVDKDGVDDFVLVVDAHDKRHFGPDTYSELRLYSGKKGALLAQVQRESPPMFTSLGVVGDTNGDGVLEFGITGAHQRLDIYQVRGK